jgi:enamine deaminase RidA (YjgF/YER057c/UK114 family)
LHSVSIADYTAQKLSSPLHIIMSHLQYYSYKGFGEDKRKELWYNQAVRVGDRIECAGQGIYIPELRTTQRLTRSIGGWDPITSKIHADLSDEIDQAFANVDLTLKHAGGKGWCQVFRVNLYLVDINEKAVVASVGNLRKWMPDHQPILTCIGVKQLGLEGMRIEIEAVAHDEEGARVAAAKASTGQS